jgi:hypothetical protein
MSAFELDSVAWPDWWTVDSEDEIFTLQDAQIIVNALPGRSGVSVREQDTSRAFGDGFDLYDAFGHKQLAIYSQVYPLDATRREAVLEMFAKNNSGGTFTNGGVQVYGGGNIAGQSDSSVLYPIYWIDGDTGKKLFLLKKGGGVVFGGEGSAPPDGDISNGGFALWLDPSNGATKLMIKAKSTNGTVVSGSVTLS